MPVPSITRPPKRLTSLPTPSAAAMRVNAKALITALEANASTPKLCANSGIVGATMPKPAATKNATLASTATSRGRPSSGPRRMSRAGRPVRIRPRWGRARRLTRPQRARLAW